MVKFYESLTPDLTEWCMAQPLFYIASAPLFGSHINISPKGLPSTTFSILGPNKAAYIDATGSGAETIAHLYENGRCTVMLTSFDKTPRILRLFCKGKVIEFWEDGFLETTREMGMEVPVGARAVIVLDIFKVCLHFSSIYIPLVLSIRSVLLPFIMISHASDNEAFLTLNLTH
jgi:hypothetical protein